MTDAALQRRWPFALAVFAGAAAGVFVWQFGVHSLSIAVPAATLTFGIVVAGFVATQRNMLLAMGGSEIIRFALRTGYHKDILAYLADCIGAGLAVTAISIPGLLLGESVLAWAIWLCIQGGAVTLVVCLMARNELLMFRIIKRLWEENT